MTDSSARTQSTNVNTTNTNKTTDVNSSDTNGSVDTNTSNNTTENNATLFDESDATFDAKACDSALFNGVPIQDTSNTPRATEDKKNGLVLKSLFDETVNEIDSLVTLYHNNLPAGSTLKGNYIKAYGDNAKFYVAYDPVWINVENNVVYVKAPAGIFSKVTQSKPSCFKITLNKELGSDVEVLKVYR